MITLVPLSGFLGAGKTTTLISAAIALQRTGRRVAVVTNDHGRGLVDTQLTRGGLGDVAEVAGGCFCRRFEELAALVLELTESWHVDTVLVETVGSCADLQSSVLHPLRQVFRGRVAIAPLTAVVDPVRLDAFERAGAESPDADLAYLFGRQLAEADLLAINKSDLMTHEDLARLEARLAEEYPHAKVVTYSAATGAGMDDLLRAWSKGLDDAAAADIGGLAAIAAAVTPAGVSAAVRPPASVIGAGSAADGEYELDYARFSDAESQLAWLNQTFTLTPALAAFDALAWGRALLRHLSDWSAAAGYFVGHAKVAVRTPAGLAKLSLTAAGAAPRADRSAARPVDQGTVTLNVRVACPPVALDHAVREAIDAADAACRVIADAEPPRSFRRVHPVPVHRLETVH
ncbi:MAG: GTP-binding protein [Actinocrinis sp.]